MLLTSFSMPPTRLRSAAAREPAASEPDEEPPDRDDELLLRAGRVVLRFAGALPALRPRRLGVDLLAFTGAPVVASSGLLDDSISV